MVFKKILITVLLLLWCQASLAIPMCSIQLLGKEPQRRFELSVGSTVLMSLEGYAIEQKMKYLGRLMDVDNTPLDHGFFDPTDNKIHFVAENRLSFLDAHGQSIEMPQAQKIARTLGQERGTCAAFALYNCLRQLHYAGDEGNGKLATKLKTERGRTKILVGAIDDYYMDDNWQDGISETTSLWGYKHRELSNRDIEVFKSNIEQHANRWPVLIRFDVPPNMGRTPYSMLSHAEEGEETVLKQKIWLPRASGEKKHGGHMIVISGVFKAAGRKYLLVQDANWETVRLWDFEELNNLFSAHLRAWVVYQDEESRPF